MSAFVVTKACIDTIVSAMRRGDRTFSYYVNPRISLRAYNPEDLDQAGRILWAENIRSVRHRYSDHDPQDLPGPILPPGANWDKIVARYTFPHGHCNRFDDLPWQVIFAEISCYEYQSCECPEWESTDAMVLLRRILGHLLYCERLPDEDEVPKPGQWYRFDHLEVWPAGYYDKLPTY